MSAQSSTVAERSLALPAARAARAAGGGVLAAGALFAVLHWALVPGFLAVLVVLLLVVAVPVCRELPHRVATNLALVIGWAPLTWWVDWPVRVDHGATLAGVAGGGLVAYVLLGKNPRARVRTLVPQVARADLLLAFGGLSALVAVWPLASARSPRQALMVLVPGVDNWAHLAMFTNMRADGAVGNAVGPAPDGTAWGFGEYPKHFHGLLATWSEVMSPRLATGAATVPAFAQGVALVVVLGTLMVVAAALTLSGLRRDGLLAAPTVVLVLGLLLWEPGQKVLADGFAPFWLGAASAGTALLLGLAPRRTHVVVQLLAVTGLVMCVAQTWTPLVVMAAPAIVMPFLSERGGSGLRRRVQVRYLALGVVLLVLAGAAALKVFLTMVGNVSLRSALTQGGGIDGTSPLPTFTLLAAMVVVLLVTIRSHARSAEPGPVGVGRAWVLLLAVGLGVGCLTLVLVIQLQALGTTSYYFLKLLIGTELILAVVVPPLCAHVFAARGSAPLVGRQAVAVRVAVTALAILLVSPALRAGAQLWSTDDDGTAGISAPYRRGALADGVLAAVASTSRRAPDVDYLAVGEANAAQIFYPDAWFHAVNASVTSGVFQRLEVLRTRADSDAEAAALGRRLLEADPRLTLMVPVDHARAVAGILETSDGLGHRVRAID